MGDGEPAGWPRRRSGGVEESPDSTGQGCWREPGRGDLPVQGNREQTADGGTRHGVPHRQGWNGAV